MSLCAFHSELNIKYLKFDIKDRTNAYPRIYRLDIKQKGNLGLSAVVKNSRQNPNIDDKALIPLRIVLAKAQINSNSVDYNYLEGSYSNPNYATVIRDLEEGSYAILVWYSYDISTISEYQTVHISVSLNAEYSILEGEPDKDFKLLNSIIHNHLSSNKVKASFIIDSNIGYMYVDRNGVTSENECYKVRSKDHPDWTACYNFTEEVTTFLLVFPNNTTEKAAYQLFKNVKNIDTTDILQLSIK